MANTQEKYDPEWSPRKAAFTFAGTMLDMRIPESLSLDARARWNDAKGLLYGMYDGRITTGEPRITQNLIAVLDKMPATTKAAKPILDLIGDISRAGLSVQGLDLTRALRRDSGNQPATPRR